MLTPKMVPNPDRLQSRLERVLGKPVSAVWPVYQATRHAFLSHKRERDGDLHARLEDIYLAAYDLLMDAPVRSIADASALLRFQLENATRLHPDTLMRILAVLEMPAAE